MGSTTCCPVALRQPRPRQTTVMMPKRVMTNKKVAQVSWLMRTAVPVVMCVFVPMRTVALIKALVLQDSKGLKEKPGEEEEEEHRSRSLGSSRGPSPE